MFTVIQMLRVAPTLEDPLVGASHSMEGATSNIGPKHKQLLHSTGEAELHGIAAGMAQGLGLRALARDLGFEVTLTLHSDATAASGIARRRSMGKTRHLDCTDLWIQEKIRSK